MKALSHVVRIKLLGRLCEGEATFGELASAAGVSSGNVTYHLGQLESAGLVTSGQGGRSTTSKISRSTLYTILPAGDMDRRLRPVRRRTLAVRASALLLSARWVGRWTLVPLLAAAAVFAVADHRSRREPH